MRQLGFITGLGVSCWIGFGSAAFAQVTCARNGPSPNPIDPTLAPRITAWVTQAESNLGLPANWRGKPAKEAEAAILALQAFVGKWENAVPRGTVDAFFRDAVAHGVNVQYETLMITNDPANAKTHQFWVDTEAARAAACLALIQVPLASTIQSPLAATGEGLQGPPMNEGSQAPPPRTPPNRPSADYDPIPKGWSIKIDLPGTLSVGAEYCTQLGKCQVVGDDIVGFTIGGTPVRGVQGCQSMRDAEPCMKARIPVQVLAASPAGSVIVRLKGRNYAVGGLQWSKRAPDGSFIGGPVSVISQGVSVPLQMYRSPIPR
jgi:hypothetical protein